MAVLLISLTVAEHDDRHLRGRRRIQDHHFIVVVLDGLDLVCVLDIRDRDVIRIRVVEHDIHVDDIGDILSRIRVGVEDGRARVAEVVVVVVQVPPELQSGCAFRLEWNVDSKTSIHTRTTGYSH